MAKYKISHDREQCISCGACESICSNNWTLQTKDGKADPKKTLISEEEFKENLEAAEICPINIIHIKNEETGKDVI